MSGVIRNYSTHCRRNYFHLTSFFLGHLQLWYVKLFWGIEARSLSFGLRELVCLRRASSLWLQPALAPHLWVRRSRRGGEFLTAQFFCFCHSWMKMASSQLPPRLISIFLHLPWKPSISYPASLCPLSPSLSPPSGADVARLVNYCHFRLVSAHRAHTNMS